VRLRKAQRAERERYRAQAAVRARRTPQQQADAFVGANRDSLVVAGRALGTPGKPKGVVYTLANGSRHRLGEEACALLPAAFPKWKVGDL